MISPMKLIGKPSTLGLSTRLCNVILDFPSNRPQTVQIGSNTSSTPQDCVLSQREDRELMYGLNSLILHCCSGQFNF